MYHMYINFMTMNFHTHEHVRKSAISTADSGLKQKFTSIFLKTFEGPHSIFKNNLPVM